MVDSTFRAAVSALPLQLRPISNVAATIAGRLPVWHRVSNMSHHYAGFGCCGFDHVKQIKKSETNARRIAKT